MRGDGWDGALTTRGRGTMALWALMGATAMVTCVTVADLVLAGDNVMSPVSPVLAGAVFACVLFVALARWGGRRGHARVARALTLAGATLAAITAIPMLLLPVALALALPLAVFGCSDTWATCSPRIWAMLGGGLASALGAVCLITATAGLIRTHYRRGGRA